MLFLASIRLMDIMIIHFNSIRPIISMKVFDYVIVGGGSSGCVLANRLSENPNVTVCLIEAGPSDRSPFIHIPLGLLKTQNDPIINWRFSSAPQKQLKGRELYLPRGKTLGGSSSINGMIYIRGHRLDYDEWSNMGNMGWDFKNVLPYFLKSENNESFFEGPFHGKQGPLNIRHLKKINPLHQDFLSSAESLQYKINPDFNGAAQEGFGIYQVTQKNGRRNSTSQAFLKPIKNRKNLKILLNSIVTKINLENLSATGVSVVTNGLNTTYTARREVILAAGTFISPKLLLLSGIGSSQELKKNGITVVHHLPGVGKNLQDHLNGGGIFSKIRSTVSYGVSFRALPKIIWSVIEYSLQKKGLFSSNLFEAGGFIRTVPGIDRPDIQLFFVPAYREPPPKVISRGHGFFINAVLLSPKSRGEVLLRNNNPFADPVINPKFFSDESDLEPLIKGLKIARNLIGTEIFRSYEAQEFMPGSHVQTDNELGSYIRENAQTIFHPVGTCKMGVDDMAVVDSQLRVHGINNLRVVDGSIMPTIIGGNTNAPIIMIAEKAADMIKMT